MKKALLNLVVIVDHIDFEAEFTEADDERYQLAMKHVRSKLDWFMPPYIGDYVGFDIGTLNQLLEQYALSDKTDLGLARKLVAAIDARIKILRTALKVSKAKDIVDRIPGLVRATVEKKGPVVPLNETQVTLVFGVYTFCKAVDLDVVINVAHINSWGMFKRQILEISPAVVPAPAEISNLDFGSLAVRLLDLWVQLKNGVVVDRDEFFQYVTAVDIKLRHLLTLVNEQDARSGFVSKQYAPDVTSIINKMKQGNENE